MHVLVLVHVLVLESAGHSAEHFDDANQESLAVGKSLAVGNCSRGRWVQEASHVEDGSALHGGTTCDGVIPAPIGSVGFGRTFGNIERNRDGRTLELVGERCIPTWDAFGNGEGEREEFDAALVDVKAFVVQHATPIGPPGAAVSVHEHEHEHVHEDEDVHEYEDEYEGQTGGTRYRSKPVSTYFPDGHIELHAYRDEL